MKNILDKSCRESQNRDFMFDNFFLNSAVYEVIAKNKVEPKGPQMTQYGAYSLHAE